MREALRIKTFTGIHLINSDVIDYLIFNDASKYLKVGVVNRKSFSFAYDDLLELDKLKDAYCNDELSDYNDGEGIFE